MDLYLPGPPLGLWLDERVGAGRMALWAGAGVSRGIAAALRRRRTWTELAGAQELAGLVVVAEIAEACEVPAAAQAAVRRGGWVIELGVPPRVSLWPGRWRARRRLIRRAAELRAGEWLARGCYAIEQWAPVDTPRLLVTCGRVRAIPAA